MGLRMFKPNDTIYTEEDIYIEDGRKVFNAYTTYQVYEIEDEYHNEPEMALINELGMLHALKDMQHMFLHVH